MGHNRSVVACRIDFHVEPQFEPVIDREALTALAQRVFHAEEVPQPVEVGIVAVDDEIIRDLNRRYRGESGPTDVLSFGTRQQRDEPFIGPPDGVVRLGEVIISVETAWRQAEEAGRMLADEVSHLRVHGLLHLLGYDHDREEEQAVMRAREEQFLAGLRHEGG